jgi:hypothetical protein
MALLEQLRKAELEEDVDLLREGVRFLAQQLMEAEVAQHVGADMYERTAARTRERNGYRDRSWDTRVGSIELRVRRVRDSGYYPDSRMGAAGSKAPTPRDTAEHAWIAAGVDALARLTIRRNAQATGSLVAAWRLLERDSRE